MPFVGGMWTWESCIKMRVNVVYTAKCFQCDVGVLDSVLNSLHLQYAISSTFLFFFADTNNRVQFGVIQQLVARAGFKQRNSDYITPGTSKSCNILLICYAITFNVLLTDFDTDNNIIFGLSMSCSHVAFDHNTFSLSLKCSIMTYDKSRCTIVDEMLILDYCCALH